MKMNYYDLADMSGKGIACLPKVLDEMGYAGRYTISNKTIAINSNISVLAKAIKKAEDAAHGTPGYLVCIKQVTYSKIWIPETDAPTQDEAYVKALDAVGNGWKVDNDAEISVKAPVEDGWHDSYYFENKRNEQ